MSGSLRPDVHESPVLQDDEEEFDPVPPGAASTAANSSCDTSPDVVSPAVSRCSDESSQERPDTPTPDGLQGAVLQDEGPD